METKRSAINFCSVLVAGGPHGLVATEYSFATITYKAYVMSFQPFKQSYRPIVRSSMCSTQKVEASSEAN